VNRVLLSSTYLSVCFVFSFLSAYCLSVHIRICRRISHDIPDIPRRGRKGIRGLRRGRLSSSLAQSFRFIIPVPLARFTYHRGICIPDSSNLPVLWYLDFRIHDSSGFAISLRWSHGKISYFENNFFPFQNFKICCSKALQIWDDVKISEC